MTPIHAIRGLSLSVLALSFFLWSCRSGPGAGIPEPAVQLEFNRIETAGPEDILVYCTYHITNPRGSGASFKLGETRIFVNGAELTGGGPLEIDGDRIPGESAASFTGLYRLDLRKVPAPSEENSITLKAALDFDFAFDNGSRISVPARGELNFPPVQEPVFTIEAIRILQAELINTRLKVRVRIHNPNPFPVQLSSLRYELYGAGRFWANGNHTNQYTIPGEESAEADLYLVMNFTNMRRDMLDRIIELRQVAYRFSGTVEISVPLKYLPVFTGRFELQGESEVIK
ncbi:MAG: LEA type 2 family protein [Spirochaetaceae bacterium]|jgi:LEA14-like dessication related protein|nr:LEA type 2 family protein [Spirochaetaceae bacterium]